MLLTTDLQVCNIGIYLFRAVTFSAQFLTVLSLADGSLTKIRMEIIKSRMSLPVSRENYIETCGLIFYIRNV